MKIDTISSLAEVMPYYGTLDEVYKLMGCCCIRTKNIFEKCRVQIGKIIKRKCIDLDLNTLCDYFQRYNQEIDLILTVFAINRIQIKNKTDYESFIFGLTNFKHIKIVKIKQINMYLSSKDDFSITYENICNKIVYNDDDRSLDELYNKAITTIKQLNMNVESIKSFLFLEELENRKIISLDRVIAIISEEMDVKSFTEYLNKIKTKAISINITCLIVNSKECLKTYQLTFPHIRIFCNMKCNSFEIFVNSQFEKNITSSFYPSDKILEYQKYFDESYCRLNGCHLSGSKNVEILYSNIDGEWKAWQLAKLIKINFQNEGIKQLGDIIQIIKCNQLIIEFDAIDGDMSDGFYNIYESELLKNLTNDCILVNPDCIENICNLTGYDNKIRFKNLKRHTSSSFDISKDSEIVESLFKVNKRCLYCHVNASIESNFDSNIYSKNIYKLKKHYIKNIEIDAKSNLSEDEIIDILNPLMLTKKIKNFKLKTQSLKFFNAHAKGSFNSNLKLKVTIETKRIVDAVSTINLKKLLPNVRFICS